MAKLRCVFYDPDAVDAGTRLSERAFEACARAEIAVFALAGRGCGRARGRAAGHRVRDARAGPEPEECIGVGAALATRRSARSG